MSATRTASSDRPAVIAATVAATVMIAQQIGGKATRDALFLSNHPATELPKVMIASAGLSVVAVLLMSRGLTRFGPARLVPGAFLVSAALFVGEWSLAESMPSIIAWAVYLHMAVFGSIVISGFWSVVNERFDPHAAKKRVARIASGATFGGVVGGVLAERMAVLFDVRAMLMLLAALNVICAVAVLRIGRPKRSTRPATPEAPASGLKILSEIPYLQLLAALVALVAVTAALADYAFKAEAASRLESGPAMMQFFAIFYTVTGLLAFLLQTFLARRSLSHLGLDGTIALLPGATVLFGVLGAAATRLWTAVLLRGAQSILANSLFRSGYELLYTPLSPAKKRPTKTIIDVAFERLGDALGSAVVMVVLFVRPESATTIVIVIAAIAAALALWLSRKIHDGYVASLADSLRSGAVTLEQEDVLDATTRRTLTETTMALDREKLLDQIRQLRSDSIRPSEAPPGSPPSEPPLSAPPPPRPPPPPMAEPELVAGVTELHSGDPGRIAAFLEERIDPRLASHVIPLLQRDDLHRKAIAALREVAPKIAGQLVDALLDEEQPFAVRRRIPRILRVCPTMRTAQGLFAGLSDSRFEVRFQCGQALLRVVEDNPEVVFPRSEVFLVVERELEVSRKVLDSQRVGQAGTGDDSPWLDDALQQRQHRSLEHVFAVLSFALDPEPLRLSLRALDGKDPVLRGTALEYLENVLPDTVRRRLWPYLGQRGRPEKPSQRARQEIVEDLLRSMDSLQIDREALRRGPGDQ